MLACYWQQWVEGLGESKSFHNCSTDVSIEGGETDVSIEGGETDVNIEGGETDVSIGTICEHLN